MSFYDVGLESRAAAVAASCSEDELQGLGHNFRPQGGRADGRTRAEFVCALKRLADGLEEKEGGLIFAKAIAS